MLVRLASPHTIHLRLGTRCADPEPSGAQANVSAKVLFQNVEAVHTYGTSGPQMGLNVTIQDTADVLSRLEVSTRAGSHA